MTRFLVCLSFLIPAATAQPSATAMEWQATIDASLDQAWDAFTTKKGIESWNVAQAEIDLRVGGTVKTSYDPKAKLGDDSTIIQSILSFEPKRMFSFRLLKAPANAQFAQVTQNAWYVLYFDPVDPRHTHVRLVGMGFGAGPEWDRAREFFQQGNDYTLEKLKEHFAKK
jgi:uncharacterized protein YndB with AHSA1/START domain